MEDRDFDADDGVAPSFGMQGARVFFLEGVSCGPLPERDFDVDGVVCSFDKLDSDLEVDVVAPCIFVDLLLFNFPNPKLL